MQSANRLISRGHSPGGGMISPDRKYFYLNIPKNASTFTTNLLKANGWEYWNLSNREFRHVVIVLRNPIDRWISGFATYASSWLLGTGYGSDHFVQDYNSLVERLIFDNIVFDDHTEPQSTFVKEIPENFNKIFLMPNNGNLVELLNNTLDCKLTVPDDIDDNSAESNYDTEQISRFIRDRLTLAVREKISNAYREDFRMIDNIQVYNNDAR
jgi:hypothetical protein